MGGFQSGGTKLERFLPKIQHIPKEIIVMGRWQKSVKIRFDFQSQFSMSKIIEIFFNFLRLVSVKKDIKAGYLITLRIKLAKLFVYLLKNELRSEISTSI